MALEGPAQLVFSPSVQQVENRVLCLRIGVVAGRGVDKAATPLLGHRGEVTLFPHNTMGNVFMAVEICVGGGNLDRAAPLPTAKEGLGGRIRK